MRTISLLLWAFVLALPSSSLAQSAGYPVRPVKIIVPTAPGGSIDSIARMFAERLSAKWGQSVVIENKAGGGMRIGADYVAKSAADGYTLLFCHDGTLAVNAVAFKDLPYDPIKDFVPLG